MRFKAPPHNSCEKIDHMRDLIERSQIYQADYIGANAFNDIAVEKYSVITFDWWSGIYPAVKTIPLSEDSEYPYGLIYAKKYGEQTRKNA